MQKYSRLRCSHGAWAGSLLQNSPYFFLGFSTMSEMKIGARIFQRFVKRLGQCKASSGSFNCFNWTRTLLVATSSTAKSRYNAEFLSCSDRFIRKGLENNVQGFSMP